MKSLRLNLTCLLAVPLLLLCCSTTASAFQSEPSNSVEDANEVIPSLEGVARDAAIQLVRQLTDPSFERRQEATRQLWMIGKPAVELLQGVVESGLNSEARMRAKDLVTLIKAGVKHDAEAEVVRCVAGFLDWEIMVQGRAIRKLCYLDKRTVARKLIAMVPSASDRTTLLAHCTVAASDAEIALRMGDHPKFTDWINDPSTRKSNKLLYYYHLWVDEKLDGEINRLKDQAKLEIALLKEFDEKKKAEAAKQEKRKPVKKSKKETKAERPPPQPELRTLIGLLRFLERWDEAIEYADKVHNREHRKELTHSILMEKGDWNRIESMIVKPGEEDNLDDDEADPDSQQDGLAYPAEGYKKALIHFYAGNSDAFNASIDKIETGIEEEIQKQKQMGVAKPEGNSNHADFLRYTLNFDRALKFTALKKNEATFRMLSDSRRYEKLLEVFKLQTYKQRAKYFKGRMRHIRSLQKQVDYFTQQDNDEQKDVYIEKRDSELAFYRSIVNLLATLGMDAEAELYFRQLFFELSDEAAYIGSRTALDLQAMGANESAWEIAEIESKRDKNFNFCRALFNQNGAEHLAATFLDSQLKSEIEDPITRYRKIAQLIKSPLDLSGESIDFWHEIAKVDFSKESDSIKYLFIVWGLNEDRLFQKSDSSGDTELGEQLMKDGNYLLAAQKFEAKALTEGYPVHYAKAWHAYSKSGNAEKATQMRLLFALKFDPDDAYDYTDGFSGTEWQSLPFDAYRLHDCLENTTTSNCCYYMWRISSGDSKSMLSAHQKMVRTQILRLRYIDSPYFDNSEDDHPRFIAGSLAAGDIETARNWFIKLSTYSPADSGFVENSFPAFRKVGNDEFADEIFQKISKDFFVILESFPDSAMYLNNYAWACACAERNIENGIEISKRAVALRPGTAGYFDTLAVLYHVNGDHDLAIETIRRAIEINPMREYYREQLKKFRDAKK